MGILAAMVTAAVVAAMAVSMVAMPVGAHERLAGWPGADSMAAVVVAASTAVEAAAVTGNTCWGIWAGIRLDTSPFCCLWG